MGNEVLSCQFDYAGPFSEGLSIVQLGDQVMAIEKNGKEAFKLNYDGWGNCYSEGLLSVTKCIDSSEGKWGFVNKEGREVVSCKYDQVEDFREGMASVQMNVKTGFVDKSGKEVIPCIYNYAEGFSEGLAFVQDDNYEFGFIDKTGFFVIPCIYSSASSFSEGLATVQLNDKWGFVDRTGKVIIPCEFDPYRHGIGYTIPTFKGGLAKVSIDGKMAYIDKTGRTVWMEKQ
jgi:hypothetical protein